MSEHDEQVAFFDWVQIQRNSDERYYNIVSTPNEGKRTEYYGKYLKDQGMSSGFPDISVLVPTLRGPAMFIEMKVRPNKVTENQAGWLDRLSRWGYQCYVCWSSDEAINVTTEWMKNEFRTKPR
jgi:hypothetical protein